MMKYFAYEILMIINTFSNGMISDRHQMFRTKDSEMKEKTTQKNTLIYLEILGFNWSG